MNEALLPRIRFAAEANAMDSDMISRFADGSPYWVVSKLIMQCTSIYPVPSA